MEMPWRTKPAAILLMYLSGCRGGHATVDILTGRVNPSGKLAETWPEHLQDTALGRSFPDTDREVLYRESIYAGYRYFDAAGVEPAYPFGFGRSYTSFSYSEPTVSFVEGGIEASCTVTNTGAARRRGNGAAVHGASARVRHSGEASVGRVLEGEACAR